MRLLSLRLIISLIVGVTLISLAFSYYQVVAEKRSLRSEVERRAEVFGESLAGNVEKDLESGSERGLQRLVKRFGNREHLLGIAVYDREGKIIAVTPELEELLKATPGEVTRAIVEDHQESAYLRLDAIPVYVLIVPVHREDEVAGSLAVVNDVSYIRAQSLRLWRETFVRVLAQVFLIVLITLLIVRWSITGPIARAAQWMRALRTGRIPTP